MQLKHRPVLALPKTALEKTLDILSLLLIVGIVVYLSMEWSGLPDQIPIHFNAAGEADGWGGKGFLWFMPAVACLLWAGSTILEKFPHIYNYTNLTEANVERQYKNARLMLVALKAELTFFLVYYQWQGIRLAQGYDAGLGVWDLPLFLTVILGSLTLFIIRSIRLKR
ncbi:DUF1648 domain-containing protein [Paenibacillus sp. J2TS4]|uniref:DUF1648 domain-containing protein n=1 Tax=Paenibacillus sp. J2TS4 TaxID=2807194 RepID=UPI001B131984|nr:DUF1648 domain-containing protein [Paenibacillus sp. J2TS4]GIP35220.1 hypothetical protein J2TS4_44300 [Paenibacillus sp. J2TS4]